MSISQQLPTHLTHDAFGEVNVTRGGEDVEVEVEVKPVTTWVLVLEMPLYWVQ